MSRNFAGSQYLTHSAGILTAAPLTMACWVKKPNETDQYLMSLGVSGSNANRFSLISGTTVTAVTVSSIASQAGTTASPSTADWFHAAAVFAASNSRVACLNGVMGTAQTTNRVPSGINQFRIGAGHTGTTSLSGNLAHAAIWNVALGPEDIDMLGAQKVSPLLVRPDALVAYWPHLGRDTSDIDPVGRYNLTNTSTVSDTVEPPQLWLPRRRIFFIPTPLPTLSSPGAIDIGATSARPRVTVTYPA